VRVHLFDGTYELFRAHYSKAPGHVAPDGRDSKASVGLAFSLLALFDDPDERFTHGAIAFDNPIESFRNDLFAGYKTGAGIEPELRAQFDLAEEVASALGLVVWRMERWEADDALATGAVRWCEEVEQVRLMTPDKDLGQALRGTRVVQVDRVRGKLIDEAALVARRGVSPASVPDWLALVGDVADGIPGLPGFGEKTAGALLARYERIEAIPEDPSDWDVSVRGAARLAATLAERRDDALLYRQLATLITDVPLAETLADLEWPGVPRSRFEALCDDLGSDRLRARPTRWA
jgi:5'-3' exonuclease